MLMRCSKDINNLSEIKGPVLDGAEVTLCSVVPAVIFFMSLLLTLVAVMQVAQEDQSIGLMVPVDTFPRCPAYAHPSSSILTTISCMAIHFNRPNIPILTIVCSIVTTILLPPIRIDPMAELHHHRPRMSPNWPLLAPLSLLPVPVRRRPRHRPRARLPWPLRLLLLRRRLPACSRATAAAHRRRPRPRQPLPLRPLLRTGTPTPPIRRRRVHTSSYRPRRRR